MKAGTMDELQCTLDLDMKKLKFIKSKDSIEKNFRTYCIISEDGTKPVAKLNNIFIPFGCEIYNNKTILNIEINPEKNNDHHNILSLMMAFEKEFSTALPEIIPVDNTEYYSNIKESKCGYMLRCSMFGNTEIFTTINTGKGKMKRKTKILLTSKDIVKSISNIEMELGTMWISDKNYGFTWCIKKIEVVSN